MEVKTEVKVYNVDMECPQCHKGKMRPTGACLDLFSPTYPHKCTKCGYLENYHQTYPYMTYEKQNAEEVVKKHLRKTRQSEFLKMFPNAILTPEGNIIICPAKVDATHKCHLTNTNSLACKKCVQTYWLTEIEDESEDET